MIEVMTARHGAPSRDWLNPARGFLTETAHMSFVVGIESAEQLDRRITSVLAVLRASWKR